MINPTSSCFNLILLIFVFISLAQGNVKDRVFYFGTSLAALVNLVALFVFYAFDGILANKTEDDEFVIPDNRDIDINLI